MEASGNDRFARFMDKQGVGRQVPAAQKYSTAAAAAYRDKIKCEANGQEWKKPKGLKGSKGGRDEPSTSTSSSRSEPEKVKKVKAPKMARGFDLDTGAGSLITSNYKPDPEDTWKPPSPRPPRGFKEGQFLMGLSPAKWVEFLKGLVHQDDRTYHLKKMCAEERAQVVAAMSGAPPPPPPMPKKSQGMFGGGGGGGGGGGLGSITPFGDAPADASSSSGGGA